MKIKLGEKYHIIFHDPCNDGMTAAAMAKMYADDYALPWEYHPMKAGDTPRDVLCLQKSNLIFLDCCPLPTEITVMMENENNVHIIDHHETAMKQCLTVQGNYDANFNMLCSGASMAYRAFEIEKLDDKAENILRFVRLVEAKDLNQDMLKPESDYLFFALAERTKNEKDPVKKINIVIDAVKKRDLLLAEGKILYSHVEIAIKKSLAGGKRVFITDIETPAVATEIGDAVMDKYPDIDYVMMKYEGKNRDAENVTNVSLRSRTCDVGAVAKAEGGGGHEFASGYFYQTKKHKI